VTVFVRLPRIFSTLQTMESDFPFRVIQDHSLPNLEDAKEELLNYLLGVGERIIVRDNFQKNSIEYDKTATHTFCFGFQSTYISP